MGITNLRRDYYRDVIAIVDKCTTHNTQRGFQFEHPVQFKHTVQFYNYSIDYDILSVLHIKFHNFYS